MLTYSGNHKEIFFNQRAKVLWFTGLSGAGKTTLAKALETELFKHGYTCILIDGDVVRSGMNSDLGFSEEDRLENIRRVAEMSKLLKDSGFICLNCFVSPSREIRSLAKSIIGDHDFIEIYVNTPLEICEQRDPKNLYSRARAGEIPDFTGVSASYDPPENPDIMVDSSKMDIGTQVMKVMDHLISKKLISA